MVQEEIPALKSSSSEGDWTR